MSIRVVYFLKAKPGASADVIAFYKDVLPEARTREGCLNVEVVQDVDDLDNLALVADWKSRDNYEEYLTWRRTRGDSTRLYAALTERPLISFFTIVA